MNMSESYHSSYVTGKTINLTLIDAAYRDTAAAIKLESQLQLFGEGAGTTGKGPSVKESTSRKYYQQNSKVSVLVVVFGCFFLHFKAAL